MNHLIFVLYFKLPKIVLGSKQDIEGRISLLVARVKGIILLLLGD